MREKGRVLTTIIMIVEIVVIQGTEIGPTTGIVDNLHSRLIGIKEFYFDVARKMGDSRNLNGDPICYNCQKAGHFSKNCPINQNRKSPLPQKRSNLITHMDSPSSSESEADDLIYQKVYINETGISALIDSGSEISLIEARLARLLGLCWKPYRGKLITAANGSPVKIEGETEAEIKLCNNTIELRVPTKLAITENFEFSLLLGNDFNRLAGVVIDCKEKTIQFSSGTKREPHTTECTALSMDRLHNKMHAKQTVTLIPHKTHFIKVTPYWNKNLRNFTGLVRTNAKVFNKNKIYLKEIEVNFENGEALIPIVNCKTEVVKVTNGSIIGDFEIKSTRIGSDTSSSYTFLTGSTSDPKSSHHVDVTDNSEILFKKLKKKVKQENVELSSEKWYDSICIFCNEVDHKTNECDHRQQWFNSEIYRARTDSVLRKIEALRRESLRKHRLKRGLYVNSLRNALNVEQLDINQAEGNFAPDMMELKYGVVSVNPELTDEQRKDVKKLLLEYEPLFAFNPEQIGVCNGIEHTIDTGNNKPIKQNPYRYSASQRAEVNRQIDELLRMGIVRPCRSAWGSTVVLVDKKSLDKNGRPEQRLCVDMRKVNSITTNDIYPLPAVRDALDSFAGSKYFSSLDMNSGYLQIKVAEHDQEKTSFITQDGLYCFRKMPFGLKSTPATFKRAIDLTLSGLKWNICIVYLDD